MRERPSPIQKISRTAAVGLMTLSTLGSVNCVNNLPTTPTRPTAERPLDIPLTPISEIINSPEKFEEQIIRTQGFEQANPVPYTKARPGDLPVSIDPNNPNLWYVIIDLRGIPNPNQRGIDTREIREIPANAPRGRFESEDTYKEVEVTGRVVNNTIDPNHPYWVIQRQKTKVLKDRVLPMR